MIQPITIKLRRDELREIIEIASGDFLGHQAGVLSRAVDASAQPIGDTYAVNGRHYRGLNAALNACMAAAYEYVADQTSADAEG